MKGGINEKNNTKNKMPLCEQFNVPSQSSKLKYKAVELVPVSTSNGVCSFVSQASSSNVATPKQKKALTNLTENYYSYSPARLFSECSSESLILEPAYSQNPRASANLTMRPALNSVKQCGFSSYNNFSTQNYYNGCLTLPNETHTKEHLRNLGEENSKLSESIFSSDATLDGNKDSEILPKNDVTKKRRASAMDVSSHCNIPTKIDLIKEGSDENNCEALLVVNSDDKQDISHIFKEDSGRGRRLTPDDVVRVIGQKLFQKARKTIVEQQNIFSFQIFELHRLIEVQRHLARSPEKSHENSFDPSRPHTHVPPMNKLLYATRLDRSPPLPKPKLDSLKPNAEKSRLTEQLILSTDAKLAPPFFHPPIANQWLVPIKSPSEGLIYKPFSGPCFPANGFSPPVYGNCGPTAFDPAPYAENYMTPVMNASSSNVEVEPKCALALFPMTPSTETLKDDKNDEPKARVIKVVPRNRNSAQASAARILQSIKEEKEIHRLSSCTL